MSTSSGSIQPQSGHLQRRIGLRSAVLFNMLEMIGVGPFITLPLVIAAAGYRLSVWAWILGAVIAVADGLVWAELGAALPRAGGSYAFLREIYGPNRAGNWLSFLYVWQLSFSAPLSIASGCIGLSSFLAWFWPGINGTPIPALHSLHYANFAAAAACLLVTALLYRRLSVVTGTAWVLFVGVMAAMAGVIVSGFAHAASTGGWHMPPSPAQSAAAAIGGLAQATLIATYDYWGYYNITFLGSEVRNPEKTIPRAILLSVLFVATMYVVMNLSALPSMHDAAVHVKESAILRLQLVAEIARSAFGQWAGYTIAALVMWTAFASVFSLLLGYSRVPFAAAQSGNYFRFLAAVHPRHGIPHRSLVALGLVASLFCFFSLQQVITMLVVTRILLQFFLQHIGVMILRVKQPDLPRPFRIPLYPLPPLFAIAGFTFILVNRSEAIWGLLVAAGIAISGTAIYVLRAKRLAQWPFAPPSGLQHWFVSKAASSSFFWSSVVCLSCFAYGLVIAVPWFRNSMNSSVANSGFGIAFAALVILTIPCSILISFGMAIFCAFVDEARLAVKVVWFLLFFGTWPVGSIVYFFTVYRGIVKDLRSRDELTP